MQWAMQQHVRPASHKFVLVALANYADKESCLAWPTVAELVEVTGLDRKTVLPAIDQLCKGGYVTDTGVRRGRTGQVREFRLALETVPKLGPYGAHGGSTGKAGSDTEIGTVSPGSGNGNGTVFPVKESQFSRKESQFSLSKSPKNGTRNQSTEPVTNQSTEPEEAPRRRGSRLPDRFPGAPDLAWARAERPDLDASSVAAQFRDHWTAKVRDATKLDWPATWRNWVRRERRQARAAPTRLDRQADIIRQLTTSDPEPIDG